MIYEIPFNKPYLTGKEAHYMYEAVYAGKLSGNGRFTKLTQNYFRNRYGFKKCLLTHSCTGALEMAAILINIRPGDEVIMPSYTFVSTANAFILRGANVVFVDSRLDHPGMDEQAIEEVITERTKAIVPVHYAGVACNMELINKLSEKNDLYVIEDAAHAIESYYITENGAEVPLGSLGHLSAFSFHETKNIISGEGGMLAVNDSRFRERSEIIWEKGTDRMAYFEGKIDKYGWIDIGSSFLPSEIIAAFLWAQLEHLENIQSKRIEIWQHYIKHLETWAKEKGISLPAIPDYATNNAHMFYLVFPEPEVRNYYIEKLREAGILAVFHYQSLHKSSYFSDKHDGRVLSNADRYSDCLLRLPFYLELTRDEQNRVIDNLIEN